MECSFWDVISYFEFVTHLYGMLNTCMNFSDLKRTRLFSALLCQCLALFGEVCKNLRMC